MKSLPFLVFDVTDQVKDTVTVFTDADKVSNYAVDAMSWAYEIGLINGMENHRLNPGWTAQCSQAATVLMRYYLLFID